MSSIVSELSTALSVAILHSIWQGCLVAITYLALSRYLKTSHAQYMLAMSLFVAAPLAFLFTFLRTYSELQSSIALPLQHASTASSLTSYFAVAWCFGAIIVGGRFFFAWVWLRVVILRSASDVPASVQSVFEASKRALRAPSRVVLRTSSLIRSPMVTGVIKPVVLLPIAMASGVPHNVLNAVFTHELLHLRRYDHVAVFVQAIGETLLFFHPAVRWLSNEARRTREYRCDDESLELIGDRAHYARALVSMEESRLNNAIPALLMNGGELMDRVERIMDTQKAPRNSAFNFLGLAVFVCVMLLMYSLSVGDEPETTNTESVPGEYAVSIQWLPPAVTQWQDLIEQAAARHNVPANVIALMLFSESGGNEHAVSRLGARGLMQVMPNTGRKIAEKRGMIGFEVEQLADPETNIDFGAWYLAEQLDRFSAHGDESLALAISAYNAGPGAVRDYLANGKPLSSETTSYRDRLLMMLSDGERPASRELETYLAKLREQLPKLVAPVEGRVTSNFGFDGGSRGIHNGVDIKASHGTPIVAPIQGQVIAIGEDDKRGKFIAIGHATGIESHYFHLSEIAVATGTLVKAGDMLGKVGNTGVSTGPHLHFEIREFGQPVSPELYGLNTD